MTPIFHHFHPGPRPPPLRALVDQRWNGMERATDVMKEMTKTLTGRPCYFFLRGCFAERQPYLFPCCQVAGTQLSTSSAPLSGPLRGDQLYLPCLWLCTYITQTLHFGGCAALVPEYFSVKGNCGRTAAKMASWTTISQQNDLI